MLITETFILIAKNIGLRKLFFKRDVLNSVMNSALRVVEEIEKIKPGQILQLRIESIRLLCMLCTVRTNRFYIPGETNLAERLRKRSFDSGVFTVLTHLYKIFKGREGQEFEGLRKDIREKVLNWVDYNDLIYHHRCLEIMNNTL